MQKLGWMLTLSIVLTAALWSPWTTAAIRSCSSADGVSIAYDVAGNGEPALIFIHGGFADRTFWVEQMKAFQTRYRVIALDLAGHGRSGTNRKVWDMPSFARDVMAVMAKENVKQAIIIGNSLGGETALQVATMLPQAVIGVVAVDTLHDLGEAPPEDYLRLQAASFRRDYGTTIEKLGDQLFHTDVDPTVRTRTMKIMSRGSGEMAARLMESFISFDLTSLARRVTQPIRCINGDLFPTQVEANRKIHPNFAAVVLSHTGHFPMIEQPERFNRELEKIISELTKKK